MNCPNCHTEISSSNINIQSDIAHCSACNNVFKISEHIENEPFDGFEIEAPPNGAWYRKEINQIVIGATTRSPIAFFLVPFMLVWSGGSIGGIYGSQFLNGEFDLFMSLFGIPFLIGSVIFWSLALMAIAGKVELTIHRAGGRVFTGIGSLGITKKFTWDEISIAREGQSNMNSSRRNTTNIVLEGKRRISFGTGLKSSRRYYILKGCQSLIAQAKSKRRFI